VPTIQRGKAAEFHWARAPLTTHTERRELRPDGIGNIAWGGVGVMLLDHARVSVTELSGDHARRSSGHCQVRRVRVPEHVKRGGP
jgi:hypothetical protein